jgi:hypothetical protein
LRLVDIVFLGILILVLIGALAVGAFLKVASQEPTPVPYVTPSPQILR